MSITAQQLHHTIGKKWVGTICCYLFVYYSTLFRSVYIYVIMILYDCLEFLTNIRRRQKWKKSSNNMKRKEKQYLYSCNISHSVFFFFIFQFLARFAKFLISVCHHSTRSARGVYYCVYVFVYPFLCTLPLSFGVAWRHILSVGFIIIDSYFVCAHNS